MNSRYTYTLLTLLIALYFVPAQAQTKKPAKKATVKIASKKPAAKPEAKPAVKKATTKPVTKKPVDNSNLGDAAAKSLQDTTKKGGGNNPNNGGSLSEEIVVTTAYKPVLADAVKIRRNPDLEDKVPFKAPLTYAPLDKRQEQNSEIRQLDPMKRPAEQDSVLTNNLVKVGAGNMKSLFGEAYFGNGRDEALQVGGHLKHFSQSGSLQKQTESRDEVGVFGKSVIGDNNISGRINYNRVGTYFYGYDQEAPSNTFVPTKQHFNTLSGEVELAKNYKDVENDFTYALKLKGYAFSNAYAARENNVVISGFLNQTVKQFYAGLSGSLDLANPKDSLYNLNNSIARINPYIKFQGANYKIDAGVNIVKEFGDFDKFYIFPAAKLEVQVVPKYVRLFVEAKGDVNRSSLRDFAMTNPFLGQNINIKNSVDQLDIAAGLKGTIAPGLSFKASVFRNSIKNMPLMVSNFLAEGNKFTVIYDDGKARVNGFNGELDFKATDDFNIFGRAEFRDYHMASEAEAWNLPKFTLTAGTAIHIDSKVTVTGSLLIRGDAYDRLEVINPSPAPGAPGTSFVKQNIKGFADLSGSVEYRINSKFSVFAQANNVLSASYQRWLYYPNYGFNIFGGVSYAF
ncbi:hypothetical protein [Mucilaginibacter celer]|uniref:TonB-dependent receptor n=1 Tax=Mucilaginibacter celer TaxID=2305508 RepID=A0A494VKS2_9SPHI|nr:hypothetical protein [Mucilaginibacter celer]AYL94071.1 hypothetical protein HYN43_001620 [Mucilaginibacter celer]